MEEYKRYDLWDKDKVPFNTNKSKYDDLDITKRKNKIIIMLDFFRYIFKEKTMDRFCHLDDYTKLTEIDTNRVSDKYDDVPYLEEHLVENSKYTMVICPGGGFCTNAVEGDEGRPIASYLNSKGISCFILKYRLNPYKAPACIVDAQRAIRYLRYHAKEFNINPNLIGLMGFSAGGYETCAVVDRFKNDNLYPKDYVLDEIDKLDATPNFAAPIYPLTSFEYNRPILATFIREDYFDKAKYEEAFNYYGITENLVHNDIPHFVCYGTLDPLKDIKNYISKCEELKIPITTLVIPKVNHGFALSNKKASYWIDELVNWINKID